MDKSKVSSYKSKFNNFLEKALYKLFVVPVNYEKSRMMTRFGLDEEVETENEFLKAHLEKFRFKLFCFYCCIGFIAITLGGSLIFFWIPRWKGLL
ncbi:hypothetical protein [Bacillus pseudomycoides]|uniref:hypothetical protein n=1 Tax=Bacillus pseudomycoides TaxID=64104 RepID=UPI000BF03DE5|nr:hypothetical protein [Bacillus pseudomycoides]PEM69290.1 hypothetical protein CN619_21375 [Bacillus pseudomycoides]PGA62246.1 hypothetical protein COL84_13830 [Bacillus pseudomycoides]